MEGIDTSDFYGPHVTNQIIKRALHPYPKNLVIVTKVGAKRGPDASSNRAESPCGAALGGRRQPRGTSASRSLDVVNMRVGVKPRPR